MNEPETTCKDCGAAMLQRTADRNYGRCMLCHSKAAAIPPAEFEIPADIAERLATLNQDARFIREMTWQHGVDFVHEFIDRIKDRIKLYQEWYPRLKAFAEECRKSQPPAHFEKLAPFERAIQKIYEEKFKHSKPVALPNRVAICSMPLIAIPVAQRLWGSDEDRLVLLTPEERSRWSDMYSHPASAFDWIVRYWWHVDDSPQREFVISEDESTVWWDEVDIPDGEAPWLVTEGRIYGPLAGSGHTELWLWNGKEARFSKNLSVWIS